MLQLLPAPPLPPDYCIFWADRWWTWSEPWWACMQKAEWSSWAQALGAMIALCVAIGLPVKARLDAYRDAKDAARAYASQMALIALDFVKACETQQFTKFEAHRHSLLDACTIAQLVPIAMLRGLALTAYMTMRSEAIEIHMLSSAHMALGNWQHWRQEFEDFYRRAMQRIDALR